MSSSDTRDTLNFEKVVTKSAVPFRRTDTGLLVPASVPERTPRDSTLQVFVPHAAVFPDSPGDFAEFKRLVRLLSRTDALLWCARLNLLMGHPIHDNADDVQRASVFAFFTPDEGDRLNA